MRINGLNQVSQLYAANAAKRTTEVKKSSATDQLEISSIGKDYQAAKTAVAAAPDVRLDKVNALKEQIQSGRYEVSGDAFADKVYELRKEAGSYGKFDRGIDSGTERGM